MSVCPLVGGKGERGGEYLNTGEQMPTGEGGGGPRVRVIPEGKEPTGEGEGAI